MKIGVTVFSYQHFPQFQQRIAEQGFFTANLGDNMQSIATRALLSRLGVTRSDMLDVDRDTLATYDGEPVALIMNGVFPAHCFPTPPQVRPIFIGLCINEKTLLLHREYFLRHQPIGCRDQYTQVLFARHGVEAYVSGCLSMSLPHRGSQADAGKVLVIHGAGAGAFPARAIAAMPPACFAKLEFIFHRIPMFEAPLRPAQCTQIDSYARHLLDYYAHNARLVLTSLHHAAAPCIGMGIPVVICREAMDARFTYLERLTPIYTPEHFERIDWDPAPVDVRAIRLRMEALVSNALKNCA